MKSPFGDIGRAPNVTVTVGAVQINIELTFGGIVI